MLQTPQAPQPTQAPRPPAQPRPAQEAAAPRTADDVQRQIVLDARLETLRIKRAELSQQAAGLTTRRNELQSQREKMSLEDGRGHEQRIRVIDERLGQLERELLQLDRQIANGISSVTQSEAEGGSGQGSAVIGLPERGLTYDDIRRAASNGAEDGAVGALAGTGTFLLFAFIIYQGVRRWIWKRKPAPVVTGGADAQQIAQLQRSMDVVAVEVERIAEAQRYVAKLLNDRALGAGDAQPVHSRGAVNADPVERR